MPRSPLLKLAPLVGIVAVVVTSGARGREFKRPHIKKTPRTYTVPFDCRAQSNNDGCEQMVRCPAGTKVLRAVAACNLEFGKVTAAALSRVPEGQLRIVTASDHVEEGRCWVQETSLASGQKKIEGLSDRNRVSVGCQEHDQNGGDCHILGTLTCRKQP